jgi:hypothetical protein
VPTDRTRRSGGGRKPVEKTADIVTLIEFLDGIYDLFPNRGIGDGGRLA